MPNRASWPAHLPAMIARALSTLERNRAVAVLGLPLEAPDLRAAQRRVVALHRAVIGCRVRIAATARRIPPRGQFDRTLAINVAVADLGADDGRVVLVADRPGIARRAAGDGQRQRSPLRALGEGKPGAGDLALQ